MNERALIIFLKYPEKGLVKTRLAQRLDQDFVLELYKHFIVDILKTCKDVDADIIIAYSFSNEDLKNTVLKKDHSYIIQKGNDLGKKMFNAFTEISSKGYSRLVIIGSDIPDLPAEIVNNAFITLDNKDAVLGPSKDGGYYLIGLRSEKIVTLIFDDVKWSTPNVLNSTIENLNKANFSWSLLQTWNDIDEYEDLKEFYNRHRFEDTKFDTMRFLSKNENRLL